ncbi:MAG: hypothetical protein IPI59_07105 [Sphingobacteriales bacterium]|jgi:hypothetical protein|nr:hypothetical protein [Sphingobacteriales bacterium]MBP9141377.1 hypothetical protein [Chitinophagales bacterium]MDA0198093.1 hypothetical protein [Bacteroidota bacterium]MBK6890168.1 hypothetical protein [Sphingobacteriales bacterium]MBK7527306.1 hypothetical protein [Sphingobacteriales bacterium]
MRSYFETQFLLFGFLLVILSFVTLTGCDSKNSKKSSGNKSSASSGKIKWVYTDDVCTTVSPFVSQTNIDPNHYAFSTSNKKKMGLTLVPINPDGTTNDKAAYQHPSWRKAGWLSKIAFDKQGNVYVVPTPRVNILENPLEKQNTIYIVDGKTGEMSTFLALPMPDTPHVQNPYGLVALTYSCTNNIMYASSIAGSTRNEEKGVIYSIDVGAKKVIDQLSGIDAMGIRVTAFTGERRLYFGKIRASGIWSVGVNPNGTFADDPRFEVSLADAGPRGDDIAREIKINQKGEMTVYGVEFQYNLIAPTEKQETLYTLIYDHQLKKWQLQPFL